MSAVALEELLSGLKKGCPLWELYCCDYHAVRWPCPCPWGVNILLVLAGINGGLLTALQVDTNHRRPQSPWPPHIGTKQADCNVQRVWVGGAAASCWSYYCFGVFIVPDWNGSFILQPSNEDKHLALCKHS